VLITVFVRDHHCVLSTLSIPSLMSLCPFQPFVLRLFEHKSFFQNDSPSSTKVQKTDKIIYEIPYEEKILKKRQNLG
jgi:hypothetical protein